MSVATSRTVSAEVPRPRTLARLWAVATAVPPGTRPTTRPQRTGIEVVGVPLLPLLLAGDIVEGVGTAIRTAAGTASGMQRQLWHLRRHPHLRQLLLVRFTTRVPCRSCQSAAARTATGTAIAVTAVPQGLSRADTNSSSSRLTLTHTHRWHQRNITPTRVCVTRMHTASPRTNSRLPMLRTTTRRTANGTRVPLPNSVSNPCTTEDARSPATVAARGVLGLHRRLWLGRLRRLCTAGMVTVAGRTAIVPTRRGRHGGGRVV